MVTFSMALGDDFGQALTTSRELASETSGTRPFRFALDEELNSISASETISASVDEKSNVGSFDNKMSASPSLVARNQKEAEDPSSSGIWRLAADAKKSEAKVAIRDKKNDVLKNQPTGSIKPENLEAATQPTASAIISGLIRSAVPRTTTAVSKQSRKNAVSLNGANPASRVNRVSEKSKEKTVPGSVPNVSNGKESFLTSNLQKVESVQALIGKLEATPATTEESWDRGSILIPYPAVSENPPKVSAPLGISYTSVMAQDGVTGSRQQIKTCELPDAASKTIEQTLPNFGDLVLSGTRFAPEYLSAQMQAPSVIGDGAQAGSVLLKDSESDDSAIALPSVSKLDSGVAGNGHANKAFTTKYLSMPGQKQDAEEPRPNSSEGGLDTQKSLRDGRKSSFEKVASFSSLSVSSENAIITAPNLRENSPATEHRAAASDKKSARLTEGDTTHRVQPLDLPEKSGFENTTGDHIGSINAGNVEDLMSPKIMPDQRNHLINKVDDANANQAEAKTSLLSKFDVSPEAPTNKSGFTVHDSEQKSEPQKQLQPPLPNEVNPSILSSAGISMAPEKQTNSRMNAKSVEGGSFQSYNNGDGKIGRAGEPGYSSQITRRAVEVSSSDSTQGWLKVRAEITGDGIHASITCNSDSAVTALRQELGGLNAYLPSGHPPAAISILSRSPDAPVVANSSSHSGFSNSPQHDSRREGSPFVHPVAKELNKNAENSNMLPPISGDSLPLYQLQNGHSFSVLA